MKSDRPNQSVAPKQELEQKEQNESVLEKVNNIQNLIKNSSHPKLCIVTIGVKAATLVAFILLDLFVKMDSLAYLVTILLGSVDFYITKNIAGRLLVGLRWWNEVKDDGSEVWIYESKNESIFN